MKPRYKHYPNITCLRKKAPGSPVYPGTKVNKIAGYFLRWNHKNDFSLYAENKETHPT